MCVCLVLSDLGVATELRTVWTAAADTAGTQLFVAAESLRGELERVYSHIVLSKYPDLVKTGKG